MILVAASAVVCCVIIGVCSFLVVSRQPIKQNAIVVVKEEFVNLMPAILLIPAFIVLFGLRFSGLEIGGTGRTSDRFTAYMALLCALGGGYSILFSLLKQTVAYENFVEVIDLLGRGTTIYWHDVTEVKTRLMSRQIVLVAGTITVSVKGEISAFKKFVALANDKISAIAAKEVLSNINAQLNGTGQSRK